MFRIFLDGELVGAEGSYADALQFVAGLGLSGDGVVIIPPSGEKPSLDPLCLTEFLLVDIDSRRDLLGSSDSETV